ncbi:MAG: Omp28-related outer membrane protein [Bacteroidota bacterium]|nr:Omp28-related outer membrane protein [Bacteroidota bacterium]
MKLSFFYIALCTLLFASCKEKEIADVPGCMDPNAANYDPAATIDDGSCESPQHQQNSLIIDFTGTWCDRCGSSGTPKFTEIYSINRHLVIPMEVHIGNDPMRASTAEYEEFEYIYRPDSNGTVLTPMFAEAGYYNKPARRIYGLKEESVSYMTGWISETTIQPPVANTWVDAEVRNGRIFITTKTKYFKAAEGKQYLAVYILEDGIVYPQEGASTEQVHNHVFRRAVTKVSGDQFTAAPGVASVHEVNWNDVGIHPDWNLDNIYLVTVIYQENPDGPRPLIVNASRHPIKN